MRTVIDTSVWVAAVRSRRGASFALLSEISLRRFRFGISVALFLEYRAQLVKTLSEGNTHLNRRQVEAVLAALAHFGEEVPIYYRLRPNLKDANDDMVFECAANFGAEVIVTHPSNPQQLGQVGQPQYHVHGDREHRDRCRSPHAGLRRAP